MLKAYLITISIETPVLLVGLSPRHSYARRLFCGFWLTACTYPVVWIVLPPLFDMATQRWLYLLVAETFAPVAECAIFWAAFGRFEAGTPIPPGASDRWHADSTPKGADAVTSPPAVTHEPSTSPAGNVGVMARPETPFTARQRRLSTWRDLITITLANLASFGIGEWINQMGWMSPQP